MTAVLAAVRTLEYLFNYYGFENNKDEGYEEINKRTQIDRKTDTNTSPRTIIDKVKGINGLSKTDTMSQRKLS